MDLGEPVRFQISSLVSCSLLAKAQIPSVVAMVRRNSKLWPWREQEGVRNDERLLVDSASSSSVGLWRAESMACDGNHR